MYIYIYIYIYIYLYDLYFFVWSIHQFNGDNFLTCYSCSYYSSLLQYKTTGGAEYEWVRKPPLLEFVTEKSCDSTWNFVLSYFRFF